MKDDELEQWRTAGRIAQECLQYGKQLIVEEATYLDVADKIEAQVAKKGGRPAFPVNLAVNEVAAHYTPTSKDKLHFRKGDIVKLDVGVHINGHIGDNALTVEVGSKNHENLLQASREALEVAAELVSHGVGVEMIGAAVQQTIENRGLLPISNLTGHAIKQYNLHSGLSIPNVRERRGPKLKKGEVVAIEPFATDGSGRVGGSRNSNIYRVAKVTKVKQPGARELLSKLQEEYNGLPFAGRWVKRLMPEGGVAAFRSLVRAGVVKSYAVLEEQGHGLVSQHEYTFLVKSNGCEVLTRL